jgi:hypothetical protein
MIFQEINFDQTVGICEKILDPQSFSMIKIVLF